ncbi:MAG: CpaD family pilus assembly lipoprotein, partial [Pseudomonadota bacterium]
CGADLAEHDYRLRYPIGIEQHTAILDIASTEEDHDRIAAFAADFLKSGGKVAVTVNGRAADDPESIAFAQDIGATLRNLGLAAGEIDLRLAVNTAERRAVLPYIFYVARPPKCGTWTTDISNNWDNAPSEHFGCATQRNLGAMVANPRDLIRVQDDQGRSGARSADIVNKYQRGQPIAAPKEAKTSSGVK